MAEMSFGARRHTAVRKAEEDSTPAFNIQALFQGCVASRPEDSGDQTPLIVDFPDRPAKMLAAVLQDYGPASRLKVQMCDLPRLPLGKLKSTEVVVQVHAASVNPTDCKQRKGMLSQIWPLSLPCILGIDLAGRVVRAGEDAPFSEGDEVFGRQQLGRMVDLNGSYAEYCIVEGADIYRKPSRLSMEEAAAVPYACLAAYAALAHVGKLADKRKQADKSVLVLGGSGGVGTFAVQLAKHHFGCFVIASCSAQNVELLTGLGADEAIDYHDPSFLRSMGYTKFDVIVDTVGGDDYWKAFKDSLKADGVYVTTVGKERRSDESKTMDYTAALSYRADYLLRQAFNSIGADKNYHVLTGLEFRVQDLGFR
jgi:NADPH:quinone reductase-like Zn-dependent oxidoreductase